MMDSGLLLIPCAGAQIVPCGPDPIVTIGFAAGHVDESDIPEVTIEGDRFDVTSESDHEWTVFVVSPPLAVDVDLSIEVS